MVNDFARVYGAHAVVLPLCTFVLVRVFRGSFLNSAEIQSTKYTNTRKVAQTTIRDNHLLFTIHYSPF